ncbi:hypothetical protein ACTHQ4_09610 [Alkalicoccobacillus gibsonii]|uniref:hypothetical protein n=1 Tax=Alkalicoccobacillus gibsonii TaxID=79881 RepID=UPI003F7B565F
MEANDKKTSKKKLIIVFGIVAFVSGLSLEPFLLAFLLAFSGLMIIIATIKRSKKHLAKKPYVLVSLILAAIGILAPVIKFIIQIVRGEI